MTFASHTFKRYPHNIHNINYMNNILFTGFYKSAEVMGITGTKEMDYQEWGIES